jgi:hypothetical protein
MKFQLIDAGFFSTQRNAGLMLTWFVTSPKSHLHAAYVSQPSETQLYAHQEPTSTKSVHQPLSSLHVLVSASVKMTLTTQRTLRLD